MEDHTHYTFAQFQEATKKIKPLLDSLPGLRRHPKTGDSWEIITIAGFEGSEPHGTAFVNTAEKTSHIAIRIALRDCGDAPFAVVRITRYFHPPAPTSWHAAHCQLAVAAIYPHQIEAIPALVAWLQNCPMPHPPENLLHQAQTKA